MESKIPLPTDNIYKFYALFGLMLFISCLLGTVLLSNSISNKGLELIKEYEILNSQKEGDKKHTLSINIIENSIKNLAKNKTFYLQFIAAVICVSLFLIFYGFRQWHTKIQPKQDELLDLQIKLLKQELNSNKSNSHGKI